MSKNATLSASRRTDTGKGSARKLRAEGRVPGVVYGRDMEPVLVSVDSLEAVQLFQTISVENTIVQLSIEGEDGPLQTLVREIQTHPFRPALLHVDFFRIQAGKAVEVEIPIHLGGVPEGVKSQGGVLQQAVHDLPVRCLPASIPESYEVDVGHLMVGESLHVSDLPEMEGVEILLDPERTICSVIVPRALVEEVEEEEEALEAALVGEEEEEGEERAGEAGEEVGEGTEEEE